MVVNATGFMHDQGKRIDELSPAEFMSGFTPFLTAQFNISKAVTPHMGGERAGAIITIVAPAASMAMQGHLGHIVGCAGIEAFIKALASELGPRNIRVLGVRSHAIVDAVQAGSYTGEIFAAKAQSMGLTVEQWLGGAAQSTMLKRLPTLAQIAEVTTFLASNHASAMTATVVNVTGAQPSVDKLCQYYDSPAMRSTITRYRLAAAVFIGHKMQRHAFNKGIQRTGRGGVKPLL